MKKNVFYVMLMVLILLIGVMRTEAQVTIGQDLPPVGGALLDLKQRTASSSDNSNASKGLMYPRVGLTNLRELNPMFSGTTTAAVKKEHIGLTVYNVSENSVFTPGIYVWDGTSWIRPVTKLPEVASTQINAVDLLANMTTPQGESNGSTNLTNGVTAAGGELVFVNRSGATDIIIPEDGSYAFSFNFYGAMDMTVSFQDAEKTAIYYLSLWKNNVTATSNLKDIAEIDMLVAKATGNSRLVNVYTYSITMAAYFNKGDYVKFKLTAYPSNYIPWTLYANPYSASFGTRANRTSMVWWAL